MNNSYKPICQKVPIWLCLMLILGFTVLSNGSLMAQDAEDITIQDLVVQPGKCQSEAPFAVTSLTDHLYFKATVPLTGKLNFVAESSVDIVLSALRGNYTGTGSTAVELLSLSNLITQDGLRKRDTLSIDAADYGLLPCDEIFFEIKSYGFSAGTTSNVCLYEPPLVCGAAFNYADNLANGAYKPETATTTVICPEGPGKSFTRIDFTTFDLQAVDEDTKECLDYIQIFDGDSPSASPLAINGKTKFCGDDLANLSVFATNWPGGCLTVQFTSNDDDEVGAGWEATTECIDCNLSFETTLSRDCSTSLNGSTFIKVEVSPSGGSGTYEYRYDGGDFVDNGVFYIDPSDFPISLEVRDKNAHDCSITKEITSEEVNDIDFFSAEVYQLIPADCEGVGASVILKITGGVGEYIVSNAGRNVLTPTPLEDDLYLVPMPNLDIDPNTGLPRAVAYYIDITDANNCLNFVTPLIGHNCEIIECKEPIAITTNTSQDALTYYCSDSDNRNLILNGFSIDAITDTAIIKIYEGQGTAGTLLATYDAENLPAAADFPLFSNTACITVAVENYLVDNELRDQNEHTIETSCSACDFKVEVTQINENCADTPGKAILKVLGGHGMQYDISLQGNALFNETINGNESLTVSPLAQGTYVFDILDKWNNNCTQSVTVTIGKDAPLEIVDVVVTKQTCHELASALVTVKGGSGTYQYSTSGDNPSSIFTTVAEDLDEEKETVTFSIEDLEGNGYFTASDFFTLVVRDQSLKDSECKVSQRVDVGDNCYNKSCGGYFYDHPGDVHIKPTDAILSGSDYDDATEYTAVICPTPGSSTFVTLDFDLFSVEPNDTLHIYNGTTVDQAEIIGSYTGTELAQQLVTSTDATGCLTFNFIPTDDGATNLGWFASIACHGTCDLSVTPEITKQTCATKVDGVIDLSSRAGGSGNYTYALYEFDGVNAGAEVTPSQDSIYKGLSEGEYIYIITDATLPNCSITDTVEVDAHPPITTLVKSPGLLCGERFSTISIIPHGGSGEYKIVPLGIEADKALLSEGEVFEYEVQGAGEKLFVIHDVANIGCCDTIRVDVNDNCQFPCGKDGSVFSSNRPHNGNGIVGNTAGYENYEHVQVTYCPDHDDAFSAIKAEFEFFETEADLDVLSIYQGTGTTGTLVGQFSGNDQPGTIISTATDRCLTLVFTSNLIDNNFDGFKANISCVDCQLAAEYTEITGETACWIAAGDSNGTISIAVDKPAPNTIYEFSLTGSGSGFTFDSGWKSNDPDDEDILVPSAFTFDNLQAGEYTAFIRDSENPDCSIQLVAQEVKKVATLEADYTITNATCSDEFGKICITPKGGSGQYEYGDDNFSMFMNTACFPVKVGSGKTITVRDIVTGCTKTITAAIGSDCIKTCGYDFFDDDGWPGADDAGTANYAANIDTTWIFCPEYDDKLIQIDFSDFLTSPEDVLTIIDGDGVGTIIGEYSGDNNPGIVRSTTGCLTVKFKSDEYVEKKGWAARVSCFYCPYDFALTTKQTASCASHDGSVILEASAAGYAATQFQYSKDGVNWTSSNTITGLPNGKTTLYARIPAIPDCYKTIDVYGQIAVTTISKDPTCNQSDGSISINAIGGSGSYIYKVNGTTYPTNIITGLAGATYTVEVLDAVLSDCARTRSVTLKPDCVAAPKPDLLPTFSFGNTIFKKGQTKNVIVNINEIDGVATSGEIKFFVPNSEGFTYQFWDTTTSVGSNAVDNIHWTVQTTGAGLLFKSTQSIPAGSRARVVIEVIANVKGAKASITANIVSDSGGEEDNSNNIAVLGQSVQN